MVQTPSGTLTRRRLLAATGAGALGTLAGCNAPGLSTRVEEPFDVPARDATDARVLNRNGGVTVRPGEGAAVSVEVVKRGFDVEGVGGNATLRAGNGGIDVRRLD